MAGTLTRREPAALRGWFRRGPLGSMRQDLRELLTDLFEEELDVNGLVQIPASLDLSETEQNLEVRADVPGMKPEDIDIQLTGGNLLTVSGQRREEKEEKGRTYHRIERRAGSFSRTIRLPCDVKEDNIDAKYRDGVLTITMQKTEVSKPKKIKVKP
jgi:HSP20 family protein